MCAHGTAGGVTNGILCFYAVLDVAPHHANSRVSVCRLLGLPQVANHSSTHQGPAQVGPPSFVRSPFTPSQPEPAGRPRASTWSKHPQRRGATPKSPAERPRRRPSRPRPAHLAQTRRRLDLDQPPPRSSPPRPRHHPATSSTASTTTPSRLDQPAEPSTAAPVTAPAAPAPQKAPIFRGFPHRAVFLASPKNRHDARTSCSIKVFLAARKFRHDARTKTIRKLHLPCAHRFFSGAKISL